jgi:hypothetical protein
MAARVRSAVGGFVERSLAEEAPAAGVTRRVEPTEELKHGSLSGIEGPLRGSIGELPGRGFYTTTEAGEMARRGDKLAIDYALGRQFGSTATPTNPTLVTLRARQGSDLLEAGLPVTPEELERVTASLRKLFPEAAEDFAAQGREELTGHTLYRMVVGSLSAPLTLPPPRGRGEGPGVAMDVLQTLGVVRWPAGTEGRDYGEPGVGDASAS